MPKQYKQFNHISIPEFLDTPAFVDESWGNDITAHSRLIIPEDSPYELWVWVYETNPQEREYPDCPLYCVSVYEKGQSNEPLDYTDCQTVKECLDAIQYHMTNICALLMIARNNDK